MKITFRVRENKDQKLIDWLNSLETGSRSKAIRNILKSKTNNNKEGVN